MADKMDKNIVIKSLLSGVVNNVSKLYWSMLFTETKRTI
mgnify:CR=1 FL=1